MEKTSQHKIFKYMSARGMLLDRELVRKLNNLDSGYAGEMEFVQWFDRYHSGQWKLVRDYWFDMGSQMQIDDILIGDLRWIVVDVKNYHGLFKYENSVCSLNGQAFDSDIFATLDMKTQRVRRLVSEVHRDIVVDSAMIFIGEHCQLMLDCMPKAKVVQRNQLKRFLEGLEYVEPMRPWLENKISSQLEFYRCAPRLPDVALEPDQFEKLKKGVWCAGCGGWNVGDVGKRWIRCLDCEAKDTVGRVVCRLAVEIRYLFYYHPKMVTTANVYELCGGKIARRTIQKYLGLKFNLIRKSNKSFYEIKI
ncbi:nuclease-related domain-containing protein [Fundicoccus sp. Sow4_H7]|uniref:nuclease-related domain-containing protein n=1 Tax=Fundicoccus sp. Sow4_H7 TaxID=3438784 RepID=UPI003F90BFDA